MSTEDRELDLIYQGMTRPAMMWGVPFIYFILNGIIVTELFLASGNIFAVLLCIPIHYFGRVVVSRDYQLFSIMFLKITKTGWHPNVSFWRSKTYSA